MSNCMRRTGFVALLVTGLLASDAQVEAQFNFNHNMNPNFVSGLTQAQYMAYLQQAAQARAALQAQNLFPTMGPGAAVNPYTPVTSNPYGSAVTNPYSPVGM